MENLYFSHKCLISDLIIIKHAGVVYTIHKFKQFVFLAVEKFGLLKSDQPILCVTAPSGHGKSALLAKLATILRKVSLVL